MFLLKYTISALSVLCCVLLQIQSFDIVFLIMFFGYSLLSVFLCSSLRPSLQFTVDILYQFLIKCLVSLIQYCYIVLIVVIDKDMPFSRFLHIQFVNFLAFLDFFCVLPFFLAVVIKFVLTSFFLYVQSYMLSFVQKRHSYA